MEPEKFAIERVISGGQTGVDRAALDAALARGLAIGGWCPRGRLAEDGPIAIKYPLRETESAKYPPRTAANVRQADATLIITAGTLDSGSKLTADIAARSGKPFIVIALHDADAMARAIEWLQRVQPRTLNVAGPRESRQPGIYAMAYAFLVRLLRGPPGTPAEVVNGGPIPPTLRAGARESSSRYRGGDLFPTG